jgi:xylan 1,4-beta-xylosidase
MTAHPRCAVVLLTLLLSYTTSAQPAADATFPVTLSVDASQTKGDLRPIYRYFGADEPNYAYMKDGKKLLKELGQLGPHTAYFRAHNLLTSGDGTPALKWGSTNVYTEDSNGNPVYDWTIFDRILDAYHDAGLKPYLQLGFMPKALSTHPDPYQHHWTPKAKYNDIYTGWAYPPKDYAKWAELIFQVTKHCVDKYGKAEVEQWWFELWNEANIGYWRGTPQEFHKLYDYTADAVKRALPTARVGGPETAGGPGGRFMRDFFEHCLRGNNAATGKQGTPIDFISFHAKGAPRFVDNHVRMGVANQLRDIDNAFALIAQYPELKAKPIIIGESDPDGCAACQGPQLGYRNTTMYSSYTAAAFARKYDLADRHGVNLEGALTWAFTFEDQPLFAGFRQLATGGIDLPVLNVFRMMGEMSGQRLATRSSAEIPLGDLMKSGVRGPIPDVAALAALEPNRLSVMIWHYHDDDLPGPAAAIDLTLSNLPARVTSATLNHYRIDHDHSNAFTAWQTMGSPQKPTPEQYAQLEKAGQLATLNAPAPLAINNGSASLHLTLPRQGVSLLVLEWK